MGARAHRDIGRGFEGAGEFRGPPAVGKSCRVTRMTTIFFAFILGLGLALLLTPVVGGVAKHYGLVDIPSGRKVHTEPIPRIGGAAIVLGFYLTCLGAFFYSDNIADQILNRAPYVPWLAAGSALVFLMGLVDDIRGLPAGAKFGIQGIAALLAYEGGIRISLVSLPWDPTLSVGWLSLPLTLLWFLMVINAINLIDGLDGLAAGVTVFTALVLLASSIMAYRHLVAMGLAALAGTCLGFLRYNFNPASIFMGDGGSYFLGYILAALSILGSIKSRAAVAVLIPIIALGLPLMDTILSAVRRFVVGKNPFEADKGHIHHRLLAKGLTQRNAVLLMYGVTILFGVFALILINVHDRRTALVMMVLSVSIIFGIRKLGYLDYMGMEKVVNYLHDVTDVMGLAKDRRTFLNLQIAISQATDLDDMWARIIDALKALKMDEGEMLLDHECIGVSDDAHYAWRAREVGQEVGTCEYKVLSLDLPLVTEHKSYGCLRLRKDLMHDPISHYTLRRIEHLRRSAVRKLKVFEEEKRKESDRP